MNILNLSNNAIPKIYKYEVLRYMGCRESSIEIDALVEECINECEHCFSYRIVSSELTLLFDEYDNIMIGENTISSKDLKKNLLNCDKVLIFAATVGIDIDRLIHKYSRISPSKAVCMQAIGAERIEALCDFFCEELKKKYASCGYGVRPRFSPGYGDLPLDLQNMIFNILDCERRIGLTLNDSLLMSPTKSVTAIVGIYDKVKKII